MSVCSKLSVKTLGLANYSWLNLLQSISASEMEIKRLAQSQSADLNFRLPEVQEHSDFVLIQPTVMQDNFACLFVFKNLFLKIRTYLSKYLQKSGVG